MSVKHMMYSDNLEAEMCTKIASYHFTTLRTWMCHHLNFISLDPYSQSSTSLLEGRRGYRNDRVVPIKYKLFKDIQKKILDITTANGLWIWKFIRVPVRHPGVKYRVLDPWRLPLAKCTSFGITFFVFSCISEFYEMQKLKFLFI